VSDKEKIKAAVSKLRKRDPRVIAIRNMIALAKARGTPGEKGLDGMRGADGLDGINGKDGIDGMRGADGMHGAKGLDGLKGEIGAVGPQGEKGEAGMIWRGTYRNDIEYDIGDVVGVSGSAYVCIAPTNQAPPVGFGWELLVSRGAQGVRGIKGEAGAGAAIDLPVSIANGGTGKTTDKEAINALLPSQVGKSGKFLSTEGVNLLWADASIPAVPNADELTGSTLAANVVTSSLTSTGTLAALTVTAPIAGSITGNAGTATSATTAGTVTTAAQPTITSVGTLTSLTTSGVITGTNTTASTSSTTGALLIAGGFGVAKDCFVNGLIIGTRGVTGVTAFGESAHYTGTGIYTTAVGNQAGFGNTGAYVTAIGVNAAYNNAGEGNTAIGLSCLQNGTGAGSTAIGSNCLQNNTGGSSTAIGANGAFYNSGANLTAMGGNVAYNNTGADCTAIGYNVLRGNNAAGNTAIGSGAMYPAAAISGINNTAGGLTSLDACTSGTLNSAWGANSLGALTTGASNVGIGSTAGNNLTTGSDNTIVGAAATVSAVGDTNSIVIGKGAVGLGSNTTIIGVAATTETKLFGQLTLDATACISASTATALALKTVVPAGTGITPTIQIICPSAAFTLTNGTATQAVFNTPQDTITLQASTTYMFEGQYLLTTGTTLHTTAMSFVLTTATITNCTWSTIATGVSALNASTSGSTTGIFDSVAGGNINTGSSAANTMISFKGIMRVNAAGTLVPNIAFSFAPGGTNSTLVGSYLKFYPIGSNTISSVGTAIG
jgi:hypothetical protein